MLLVFIHSSPELFRLSTSPRKICKSCKSWDLQDLWIKSFLGFPFKKKKNVLMKRNLQNWPIQSHKRTCKWESLTFQKWWGQDRSPQQQFRGQESGLENESNIYTSNYLSNIIKWRMLNSHGQKNLHLKPQWKPVWDDSVWIFRLWFNLNRCIDSVQLNHTNAIIN